MKIFTIARVKVSSVFDDPMFPELKNEYEEECRAAEMPSSKPDPEYYMALQEHGLLSCAAAYVGDRLIGFVTVLTTNYSHYGEKLSSTESLFLSKKARKCGAGLELLKEAETIAREAGSPTLLVSAPRGGVLEKLLPHWKYRNTNSVFMKDLRSANDQSACN